VYSRSIDKIGNAGDGQYAKLDEDEMNIVLESLLLTEDNNELHEENQQIFEPVHFLHHQRTTKIDYLDVWDICIEMVINRDS
jgi:hypothetical protein